MILKNNNSTSQFKGTTLRGFNNTVDNIRKQMETAKDPWKQKEAEETPKTNFDPKKFKENMTKINRSNGGSR